MEEQNTQGPETYQGPVVPEVSPEMQRAQACAEAFPKFLDAFDCEPHWLELRDNGTIVELKIGFRARSKLVPPGVQPE